MTELDQLRAGYLSMRTGGATAVVPREVIEIRGPDASRYLQGQISQDIVSLDRSSAWSFILQPTGRVSSWMRVHRVTEEHLVLEVEPGAAELLLARLRRFLMRTAATIEESAPWSLIAYRCGAEAADGTTLDPSALPVGALDGVLPPGLHGWDLLVPLSVADAIAVAGDIVDPQALERVRIEHLIPHMGADLTEDTIPAEAGPHVIAASVSFTKGCYTGQELVARIDSRGGNVPRPLRLLRVEPAAFAAGDGPVVGAEVLVDGEQIGHLTSACVGLGADLPPLALAPLPRAVEVGSEVQILAAGRSVSAVVESHPER